MIKTLASKKSVQLAAAVSSILTFSQLHAQQPSGGTTELEEVIVTGSLIAGTPEDRALPVDVTTFEDLQNLGRPSNLDLVKGMAVMGQVAGETDRYNAFPVGAQTVNLRNLGPKFSVVLFNGRRFPEQFSPVTGRFNNIAWIPNAAIGRVEVLKEGGAVTYGADAVAGVVNYYTRTDLDGLEVNGSYRYIEDSDGDYDTDVVWGKKFDSGNNIMITAAYQHRSTLRAWDRDWARQPLLVNNNGFNWSSFGSPGSFSFQTSRTQLPVTGVGVLNGFTVTPTSALPGALYTGNRQMSSTGLVRDLGCSELGGFAGWSATPSPLCYFNITQFEKLVEESDTIQLYAEGNFQLTDSLKYHVEALGYYLDLPDIAAHPSDGPLTFPVSASGQTQSSLYTPPGTGTCPATTPAPGCATSGTAVYFVDGHNPGVQPFLNNFRNTDGTTAFTSTQISSIVNSGRAAIPLGTWRPFGNGGNPLVGDYDIQRNTTRFWRLTNELKGDFIGDLTWSAAITLNHIQDRREIKDMLVERLQAALNGLGGANCNGVRADLAGSTCQWFNPFSSAIERNVYTGAANTATYNPALANNIDLIRWLYVPIWLERTYQDGTFDLVFSGDTGWELPGGPVAIGFGGQARYRTEETRVDDYTNRDINPCATLGQTNCLTQFGGSGETGALAFSRPSTVLGAQGSQLPFRNEDRRFPAYAAFFEAQFPIIDGLEASVAGRYEKFISDLTDRDNDVFVPALSVLYRPIDEIGLRVAAGETFSQVNPPADNGPILARNVTAIPGFLGNFGGTGSSFDTYNYDNVDVKPMEGQYINVGVVTNVGGFQGSIDWYNIAIDEFTRTMTAAQVITAVADRNTGTINCASPLMQPQAGLGGRPYVELVSGPCVGSPNVLNGTASNVSRVNFFGGQDQTNSGTLKTSGIDLSASYLFDALGGSLRPSLEGTYVLKWELDDFVIGGVKVASGYDGVGYVNSSTGRIPQAVPEWRASFSVNYNIGDHNVNLIARYTPELIDDDPTRATTAPTNANIGVNGVVPNNTSAACTGTSLVSPPVPAGAGSGTHGSLFVASGVPGSGSVGYCSSQNTLLTAGGGKVEDNLTVDLVYRVSLPADTTLALSVFNLFDEDPPFYRGSSLSYYSGYGSPLGRNIKLAVSKKF